MQDPEGIGGRTAMPSGLLLKQQVMHADGYEEYHRLSENIKADGCWAHARRKFDEALAGLPEKERPESEAFAGKRYCDQVFAIEENWKDKRAEERQKVRQEQAKPVLDAYWHG